jgi:hypothetical protein
LELVLVFLASALIMTQLPAAEPTEPEKKGLLYEAPTKLTGTVYTLDSDSKKLLYKFTRLATRSGSTLTVRREFTYPDGKLAATEKVTYEGDNLAAYTLDEMQIGASGSVKVRPDKANPAKATLEFSYTKEAGAKPKVRTETLAENTLNSDMVATFLVTHWDALIRGEKLKSRYLVIPRAETVGFTFTKDSDTEWRGKKAIVVKMEATSPILAALVDPLFFTLEKSPPHRVFQYAGRTTPKIEVSGKWKDLDAVTVFDWNLDQQAFSEKTTGQ